MWGDKNKNDELLPLKVHLFPFREAPYGKGDKCIQIRVIFLQDGCSELNLERAGIRVNGDVSKHLFLKEQILYPFSNCFDELKAQVICTKSKYKLCKLLSIPADLKSSTVFSSVRDKKVNVTPSNSIF